MVTSRQGKNQISIFIVHSIIACGCEYQIHVLCLTSETWKVIKDESRKDVYFENLKRF